MVLTCSLLCFLKHLAITGLAPYNYICVQAGHILSEIRSWEDIFSTMAFKLSLLALLPLAYAVYIKPRNQVYLFFFHSLGSVACERRTALHAGVK